MDIKYLPDFLKESIKQYTDALEKVARGEKYLHMDCDFCNLQSDINVAEVEQLISSEEANQLRKEYLYD